LPWATGQLESAEEDLLCARYIKDCSKVAKATLSKETEELRQGSGSRFFNPANLDFSPPTDFFLCTDLNRFNFVLRAIITNAVTPRFKDPA
jgi:2-phosphosulfolactate phosphatase